MMNVTLKEMSNSENPHVAPTPSYGGTGRFDEGEVALEKPRRGLFLSHRIIALASVLLASGLQATTITLKNNSNEGFTKGTDWSDGKAPEAGKDYRVDSGYYLRGDWDQVFKGDSLQIGVVGGTQGIYQKHHQGSNTIARLILANGYFCTWLSEAKQWLRIKGAVEVLSPASAPFCIYGSWNSGSTCYNSYWDTPFTGEEGTGLLFGVHPNAAKANPFIYLTGDNSGYLGSIKVNGVNTTFVLQNANALGGALDASLEDAFQITDNATVKVDVTGGMTWSASLNRGLTIAASGGRLDVRAGKPLRIEWPVTGPGTLTKIGDGALTLASALTTAPVVASVGAVVLADGFSNDAQSPLTIAKGVTLSVPAGDEVTVRGLAFQGSLVVNYDEATGESGVLVLNDGFAAGTTFAVCPPAVASAKIPFLKVPVSAGTLTTNVFECATDTLALGAPSATFVVETEDAYQVAYLKMSDSVTRTDESVTALYCSKYPERWSDGLLPHAGADYLVERTSNAALTFYIDDTESMDATYLENYTFPGESLTLKGYDKNNYLNFNLRPKILTGNFRIGSFVKINAMGNKKAMLNYPVGDTHILRGRLHVADTSSADNTGLYFSGYNSRTTVVESVISGTGHIYVYKYSSSNFAVSIKGTNNTYTGSWKIQNYDSKYNITTAFLFVDERSLGATNGVSSKVFMIQGGVYGKTEIYPQENTYMGLGNRPVEFVDGPVRIRVDEGKTFELAGTVRYDNGIAFDKIGKGTFAVTGYLTLNQPATAKSLRVSEGYVRAGPTSVARAQNLSALNITVAEGAGFAVKYVPGATDAGALYGTMLTDAAKLTIEGNTVAVKVETDDANASWSGPIPFLTVPTALATTLDAKKFVMTCGNVRRKANVVKDTVVVNDVSYARYSVLPRSGTVLLVK